MPEIKIVMIPAVGTDGRVPKGARPRDTESGFIHMDRLAPKDGFASMEEAQAFYEKYMPPGKKPRFPKPTEAWHQAQEIAYRGWETKSARGRKLAARRALEISPDAPDAYLLLAQEASSWEEALDLETKAVAAAERLLGNDPQNRFPEFWGPAITRPYMRARFAMGYALWRMGKHAEARDQFRDLLRLNPNDNQAARYPLDAILLELGENGEAQRLISRFSPDNLSYWAYNKILLHFRRRGDDPAARDLRRIALRANAHIPNYLLGKIQPRSWEIEFVEAGEESEAIEYTHLYQETWSMTRGALEWLGKYTG